MGACGSTLKSGVDWWINEEWESALCLPAESSDEEDQEEEQAGQEKGPRPFTEEEWQTEVIPDEGVSPVKIRLDAQRHGEYVKTIELQAPVTLRQFLSAVGGFYQHPMSPEELQELERHVPEDVMGHRSRVLGMAKNGQEVHWCDVMGSPPSKRGFSFATGEDMGMYRHPLMCNGLVRYEGLRRVAAGEYDIILGS